VDHPSFGIAIIGRLLEAAGFSGWHYCTHQIGIKQKTFRFLADRELVFMAYQGGELEFEVKKLHC
jgi:hypothetical protein